MIVKIEAPCIGNWYLEKQPFTFVYDGVEFELIADKESNVHRIRAKKSINPDSGYFDEIKQMTAGFQSADGKFLIHSVDKDIIEKLKFFENVLCVEGDLIINWDGLNSSHMPENQDERAKQSEHGSYMGWGKIQHMPGKVTLDDPSAITCRLEYSEGLDIELGFFRHAHIAAKEKNFIEAYFNYYLILESYYSGGTHKYQDRTFKGNQVLAKLLGELISEAKFLASAKIKIDEPITPDKVIDRLVEVRQKIFHFLDINKPTRRITHGEQEEMAADVAILSAVVWRSMRERHRQLKTKSDKD